MIDKLREVLGTISGYKQAYHEEKGQRLELQTQINEAGVIAENILSMLRHNDPTDKSN